MVNPSRNARYDLNLQQSNLKKGVPKYALFVLPG
jgi:hypothetical protein